MKNKIRDTWISCFDLIKKHPIVLFPFALIAFFEALALEMLCFSTRLPLSFVVSPLVKKFFGEKFLHYPGNLLLLPKLFYYAQILIYIFLSVFLIAVSVNIFKNIKSKLPLKADAIIKNTLKRYPALLAFGIVLVASITLTKRADIFILGNCLRMLARYAPNMAQRLYIMGMPLFLFITNFILHIFLVLVVPIIVIEKKPLLKALGGSIYLGFRHFFSIFALLSLPFFAYLPIVLLKTAAAQIAQRTFPEMIVLITAIGIIAALFIDCFIIVCASQFLINKKGAKKN